MTEVWKPIPSLPGYEASSEGRVRSPKGRILGGTMDRYGYRYFNVKSGERVKAHRLICEAFHGPADKEQCAHLDGDRLNNRPENLTWATREENAQHSIAHGTMMLHEKPELIIKTGADHHSAKLTAEIVASARQRYASGESGRSLAREYGVAIRTMMKALNGETWQAVEPASPSRPYGLQSHFPGEPKCIECTR